MLKEFAITEEEVGENRAEHTGVRIRGRLVIAI